MAQLQTNVLNTVFQEYLSEELLREATLLNVLPKRAERNHTYSWAVNVGGYAASGVAVTADAPAVTVDNIIAANLPVGAGSFQTTFMINEKEVLEAAESVSEPQLRNLLRANMALAKDEMLTAINKAVYTGVGNVASGGIVGLTTAVNTVDYAGVNATTYPVFRAAVIDKFVGATSADNRQELDDVDFTRMERLIREKGGRFDTLVTTPAVIEKYKNIFSSKNFNYFTANVSGAGGRIAELGFAGATYAGKPILDDAFCVRVRDAVAESAIITTLGTNIDEGVIYFLKMSDIEFLSMPTVGSNAESGIYTQTERLAKTALYNTKFVTGCIPTLVLRSRKNCGVIRNIKVTA